MNDTHAVWEWILDNISSIANLLFAGMVAIAAVVSARLSRQLVRETIQLRKTETDPFIAVYIEGQRHNPFYFDMVIRNVARGSAFDVSFTLDQDPAIWEGDDYRLSTMKIFSEGIRYMAPGQEIRFYFGSYVELTKQPIKIGVQFFGVKEGRDRTQFAETFTIDIEQFHGMSSVGETPERTMANSLDQMAVDIRAIKQGGGFSNVVVTVKRQYFFSRRMSIWRHNILAMWRHDYRVQRIRQRIASIGNVFGRR